MWVSTASVTTFAVVLLTAASMSYGSQISGGELVVTGSESSEPPPVRLFELASVRRAFDALARQRAEMTEGERAAAWADFTRMAEAVIGTSLIRPFTFDGLNASETDAPGPPVVTTRGVAVRNRVAYQMLAVGYSAPETADVLSRRISRGALDRARWMIAVGRGRDEAAHYLDSQYTRASTAGSRPNVGPRARRSAPPGRFHDLIQRHARAHRVEPAIIRAIIDAESAFNPTARSTAGAIGLMQLMPTTALELGVDPFVPEQNIEGGVRYFAQLLETFGRLELALVAYNAGPGFAERYARGQTALYGETRQYVRAVMAMLGPDSN